MRTHLIFDLGGTLIFDPFDAVLDALLKHPLLKILETGLSPAAVSLFLDSWKRENENYTFPFASHFLQEETWITRAAWPMYSSDSVRSKESFPLWTATLLATYRASALEQISQQPHLEDLRVALDLAIDRGYRLYVASNDRYFAASAMLAAAKLACKFLSVVTSEQMSYTVS